MHCHLNIHKSDVGGGGGGGGATAAACSVTRYVNS